MSKHLPEKIVSKLKSLNINIQDIEEKFIATWGKGGQKINRTAVGVYLKYKPANITLKCKESRSQYRNRIIAYERLLEKIEKKIKSEINEKKAQKAKLLRQTRKRSLQAKLSILKEKRIRSLKKKIRRKIKLKSLEDV